MAGKALCLDEREEIRAGIERGESGAAIARTLGRHRTTVSREILRNEGREMYRAIRAQRRCNRKRRRPKIPKLVADPTLARQVERGLRQGFSPPAVAALLRAAGGERVVRETIYQALYSRTFRGLALLPRNCLRTRRLRRRPHNRRRNPGSSWSLGKGFRLIDERPESAADRAEPGHWEGDLILGTRISGSAIATLVERSSRLLLLAPLRGADSWELRHALIETLEQVPIHMRKTLTWDQGSEMHLWRDIEAQLDLPIFFCRPSCPWQRGSNENTNRQLRFWFRKGTDITAHPPAFFERVVFILNNQPRRLFDWSTAQQRYGELSML